MNDSTSINDYCFALPTTEIGSELRTKVENYYQFITTSKMLSIWRKSYQQYYAGYFTAADIMMAGEQGEFVKANGNHYRNLLQHILSMTTKSRLHAQPLSINTDYKSMSQTVIAKDILDYYLRNEHIEDYINDAVEIALIQGEAFLYTEWDPNKGDVISEGVSSGDLAFATIAPQYVTRDIHDLSDNNQSWYILTQFKNKYNVAAQYPDFAEDIKSCTGTMEKGYTLALDTNTAREMMNNDNIPVYTMVHNRTAALPNGRLTVFIEDGTVVFDSDLPYKNFPITKMVPSSMKNTTFGYTIGYDLLPIQFIYNGLLSTIVSNQNAFGMQTIIYPDTCDIDVVQLTEGLQAIPWDVQASGGQKPEVLQLLKTPAELFNFMSALERMLETLSGINSVSRGNPEASLKSGAALALVQSMAIEFASSTQNAFASFAENTLSNIISTLQKFAKTPRIAIITGKTNRSYQKEFSSKDLTNINRVIVDLGNPLQRSASGRIAIADSLMEKGMLKTPEEYIAVLETGKLDPMVESPRNEYLLIKSENEKLMLGDPTPVIAVDAHTLHITEHKGILSSPDMRTIPNVVTAVLNHIQDHITALKQIDPDLLMMIGQQPILPPAPAPLPPGPPPMVAPGPQGSDNPIPPPDIATPGSDLVGMPSLPTNPLTGVKFDNETGGLPPA